MAQGYSPTVRRRELGILLRRYRVERNLTASQVAQATDIHASQISRLETAQRAPVIPYVEKLCVFYGLDAATTIHLVKLARESRRDGWWNEYDLEAGLSSYVSLESAARSIESFEPIVISGLLQTSAYARAVVGPARSTFTDGQVKQTVEARMERQKILSPDSGVRLHTVLDEAVLRRVIGGPDIMRRQLHHLLEVVAQDNIKVQILPLTGGQSPGTDGAFTLLHFSEADLVSTVLYVEGQMGQMLIEKKADTDRCRRTFADLSKAAAPEHESASFIEKAITALPDTTKETHEV